MSAADMQFGWQSRQAHNRSTLRLFYVRASTVASVDPSTTDPPSYSGAAETSERASERSRR